MLRGQLALQTSRRSEDSFNTDATNPYSVNLWTLAWVELGPQGVWPSSFLFPWYTDPCFWLRRQQQGVERDHSLTSFSSLPLLFSWAKAIPLWTPTIILRERHQYRKAFSSILENLSPLSLCSFYLTGQRWQEQFPRLPHSLPLSLKVPKENED